ncbi:hypothetical protein [Frisingicoccus sp.]|uniref:hypothetical protein n=1 Tax=Frisingicoccus sp. TaxID=1918627 RepID=UPI003AB9105A
MTKDKAKRLFLTAIILLTVAQGLSSSVFSNYFKEVYQINSVQRGFLEIPREMPGVLCVVVISLLGSLGNVSMAFIAYGLSCIGLLVLGLLSPSYGWMMVFLFISSLGEHMMMPLRDSIAIDLSQEGKTGTFLGKLKGRMLLASMMTSVAVFIGFRAGFFWFGKGVIPSFCLGLAIAAVGAGFILKLRKECPELNVPQRHKQISDKKSKHSFKKKYLPYYVVTAVYGCQKRVRLVFGPWIIIELLAKGADTLALLGIVSHFAGSLFAPLIGRFLDKYGVKKALVLEGCGIAAIFSFSGWVAGSIAGAPLFVAYLVYVLINLTDHFNTVHTFLMKKLADDPADVMENLSFGLSVDHVIAVVLSGILGIIWQAMGPQYVFYIAAAASMVQVCVAGWLKKIGE